MDYIVQCQISVRVIYSYWQNLLLLSQITLMSWLYYSYTIIALYWEYQIIFITYVALSLDVTINLSNSLVCDLTIGINCGDTLIWNVTFASV